MTTLLCYYLIMFISVFFMFFVTKKKHKNEKLTDNKRNIVFFSIALFIPFMFFLLRDTSVGVDYKGYISLYLKFASHTATSVDIAWVGYGYYSLSKIFIILFGKNYLFFFGTLGFITLYCFYKTFYEESEIPWLSLLLFFCFFLYLQTFNQGRQMLAIGLTFYAFKFIENKDLKKYMITILMAAAIHKSAIIMLPFYWISNIKITKKSIFYGIALLIVAYLGYPLIEWILLKTSYGQTYLTNSYYNYVNTSSSFNTVLRFFMLIFCYVFLRKDKYTDNKAKILLILCYFCVFVQILTLRSYVFGRITTYFFVYFLLLIPMVINRIKFKGKQVVLIYLCIVIISLLYFAVYFMSKSSEIGVDIYKLLIG